MQPDGACESHIRCVDESLSIECVQWFVFLKLSAVPLLCYHVISTRLTMLERAIAGRHLSVRLSIFSSVTIIISTLRWAVLTVPWIGFCHIYWAHFTVRRFISLYLCVFCVFFVLYYIVVVLLCEHSGVDLMALKPNPLDLSPFNALTLLVRFDP